MSKIGFFANFQYLDPISGTIQPHFSMAVSEGKILQIGNSIPKPPNTEVIDLENAYIAPGLINIHCHISASGQKIPPFFLKHDRIAKFFADRFLIQKILSHVMYKTAREGLVHGVTTIRTLGDISYDVLRFRDKIRSGEMVGPRIFAAGKGIASLHGHGSALNIAVDSVSDATKMTQVLINKGVDLIKIIATGGVTDAKTPEEAGIPQVPVEIMKEICSIAHARGLKVAAHSQSQKGIWNCIEAGVDSIEHGADYNPQQIEKMKSQKISVVPTLSAPHAYATHPMNETGLNPISMENSRRIQNLINEGIRRVKGTGILIGAGTDAGIPAVKHGDFATEIVLLHELHGFTPMQALQCATINNAQILGQEKVLGSLDPGKWADFIIFHQNPLTDLQLFKQVDAVYIGGTRVI